MKVANFNVKTDEMKNNLSFLHLNDYRNIRNAISHTHWRKFHLTKVGFPICSYDKFISARQARWGRGEDISARRERAKFLCHVSIVSFYRQLTYLSKLAKWSRGLASNAGIAETEQTDLIEPVTPCHETLVSGPYRVSSPLHLTVPTSKLEDQTIAPQHLRMRCIPSINE